MNELYFFISIVVYFSLMLLSYKLFGKVGLYCWISFAMVLANIEALKLVTMFGMPVTLGNALYGTSYIATDILSENHGRRDAKLTVHVGFFALLAFTIMSQIMLIFIPNVEDFASPALQTIFGLSPRLCIASLVTFAIMQQVDIWLYLKTKELTKGKHLWLRNNGATLIAQLFDSALFTLLAFVGIFDFKTIINLIFSTYLFKVFVSLLDTPFIYIARRIKPNVLKVLVDDVG